MEKAYNDGALIREKGFKFEKRKPFVGKCRENIGRHTEREKCGTLVRQGLRVKIAGSGTDEGRTEEGSSWQR